MYVIKKIRTGKIWSWTGKKQEKNREFEKTICVVTCYLPPGFMQRLENLENQNGHRKVMEHEILAKSHGILRSIMEFYQLYP